MLYLHTYQDSKPHRTEVSRGEYSMTAMRDSDKQMNTDTDRTVKLDFHEIKLESDKLPGMGSDSLFAATFTGLAAPTNEMTFAFEKNRIKEMGEANINKLRADGPLPEVNPTDPRVMRLQADRKLRLGREKAEVAKWALALKVLAVILVCIAILNSIYSLLNIFIFTITSEITAMTVVPMAINLLTSLWIIHMSLKQNTVSNSTFWGTPDILSFVKFCAVSNLVLLLQLILMSSLQSIPDMLERSQHLSPSPRDPHADRQKTEAYLALGYLIVWGMCILYLTAISSAIALTLLLKRHLKLREQYELEDQVLPIGYQLHQQLQSKSAQAQNIPYPI